VTLAALAPLLVLAVASSATGPFATTTNAWIDPAGYDPAVVGSPRPTLTIPRIERLPALEEFVPGMAPSPEFAGRLAHVDGGLIQRDPEDGEPASQHTDVFLAYDDDALLVVFVAFDDDPDGIRAHLAQREQIFQDDLVEIQLDTFLDRRTAYTFGCNPLGVQWDAIWTEGGQFDSSFDTVWDSRGAVTDRGYVVWMRIPFKSLRFPRIDRQTWGILLVRDVQRNDESSFWPRMSARVQGRLSQAATATGLAGISPGRNVQIIPYATATSYRELDDRDPDDPRFVRKDADVDAGVDAKFVVRDRVVVDATVFPDFSQVESDEPQVTVNERFEVFFPEKRPFFLENAATFQTPINLVFTRRIADPRFGIRVTGKFGRDDAGVLWIDDEAAGRNVPAGDPRSGDVATFRVARWSHDLGRQSTVGALVSERRFGDAGNRVGGLDARITFGDHWVMRAQWADSESRERDGTHSDGAAAYLQFDRSGRRLSAHLHGQQYDPGFRADTGFVPRVDIRDLHANVGWRTWPEGPRLISWEPSAYVQRIEDRSGATLERRARAELELSFRAGTELELTVEDARETLRPSDFPGLAGPTDYDRDRFAVTFESEPSGAFGVEIDLSVSDAIHFSPTGGRPPDAADSLASEVTLRYRPLERLRLGAEWLWTRLDLAGGGDTILRNGIVRLRGDWQFDTRSSLRVIARRDSVRTDPGLTVRDDDVRLNVDLLYRYLVNPWTALYVGYNADEVNLEIVDDGTGRRLERTADLALRDSRQLFVKVSYLFRP